MDQNNISTQKLAENYRILEKELLANKIKLIKLKKIKDSLSPERYQLVEKKSKEQVNQLMPEIEKIRKSLSSRYQQTINKINDIKNKIDKNLGRLKDVELLYSNRLVSDYQIKKEKKIIEKKNQDSKKELNSLEKIRKDLSPILNSEDFDSKAEKIILKEDFITCPKCGRQQKKSIECIQCGIIFSKIKPVEKRETVQQLNKNNQASIENHDNQYKKTCTSCGERIQFQEKICSKCGVRQKEKVKKSTLLLITFFLGGAGWHKLYTYRNWQFFFSLIFSWTRIPLYISLIEFCIYAFTSSEKLQKKYFGRHNIEKIIVWTFLSIGIIGILAAIIVPNLVAYREKVQ